MGATLGIAMVLVGLIINVVGAAIDSAVSGAVFVAGLMLMVGGVVLLDMLSLGPYACSSDA